MFREKSGYEGADIAEYGQPRSNGLTFDPEGRLTIDQHGNHRVVRVEADGQFTVLADKFEGKRLNSPNDLVYRSDGTLYFTDPPFGLPKFSDDPRKELPFSGVFAVRNGNLNSLQTILLGLTESRSLRTRNICASATAANTVPTRITHVNDSCA